MKAKFKIGDKVKSNKQFIKEGKRLFGKDFLHEKFVGIITEVHENTNDGKDGMGDIWKNNYYFAETDDTICEDFLELA